VTERLAPCTAAASPSGSSWGDYLHWLPRLPPAGVDVVVSSPPYSFGINYRVVYLTRPTRCRLFAQ